MRKALAVTALVALIVAGFAPAASAHVSTTPRIASVSPGMHATLASLPAGAMTTVIVTLRHQADLKRVKGADRASRLKGTIQELTTTAHTAQVPIRALLRVWAAQGKVAKTVPLWVVNGLAVTATADVIQELAARSDVASIAADQVAVVPSFGTPEPGLNSVSAPAMWNLGFTGQGVVVASLDSGVDITHPDLAGSWRGGANSWFDPYGEHPVTPTDLSGHGTATTGAMVGGDAGGTSIGVAPGAKWIAAKVFNDRGAATLSAIHQAFQWVLDPDHNPSTSDAPQIVNASWSIGAGPGCDLSFQADLRALRAVGIVPVFAAGNYGPGASTSVSPANYPEAVAVGAVSSADVIYSSSSRGPSTCGARTRVFPDFVAPGVNIRSTDLYGMYQTSSGTSMAAPGVSGSLAVLLGAIPGLSVDQATAALTASTVDLGVPGPDSVYGGGRINILAAYQWALAHQDFGVAVAPSDVSLSAGGSASSTVQVTRSYGSGGPVALSLSGLSAAEATWTFTPAVVPAGSSTAQLLVTTSSAIALGSHPLTVTAASGTLSRTAPATLTAFAPVAADLTGPTSAWVAPITANATADAALHATADDTASGGSNIVAAEYFIDTAGATGAGMGMTVTPSVPTGAPTAGLDATIPAATLSALADGSHAVWVHARDSAGNWGGLVSGALVMVRPLSFSTLGASNPPGVVGSADAADIYSWNGSGYSRVVDASAAPYVLPSGANVDGFDRVDATHFFLSFTGQVNVPGVGNVQDEDVVYFNAGTWSLFFDGSVHGLTGAAATDLDAISIVGGQLFFSTDNAAVPPGAGGAGDDADIYLWNGGSSYTRVIDASAAPYSLPAAANVDGFVRIDASHFYLSFGTDTTVPGLGAVQDEDVIYYNMGVWSVYFDGTAHGLTSNNLDIDAFDVP
jgi:serine protease AprX